MINGGLKGRFLNLAHTPPHFTPFLGWGKISASAIDGVKLQRMELQDIRSIKANSSKILVGVGDFLVI